MPGVYRVSSHVRDSWKSRLARLVGAAAARDPLAAELTGRYSSLPCSCVTHSRKTPTNSSRPRGIDDPTPDDDTPAAEDAAGAACSFFERLTTVKSPSAALPSGEDDLAAAAVGAAFLPRAMVPCWASSLANSRSAFTWRSRSATAAALNGGSLAGCAWAEGSTDEGAAAGVRLADGIETAAAGALKLKFGLAAAGIAAAGAGAAAGSFGVARFCLASAVSRAAPSPSCTTITFCAYLPTCGKKKNSTRQPGVKSSWSVPSRKPSGLCTLISFTSSSSSLTRASSSP